MAKLEKKGVPQPQKRRVPEGTHMHIFVRRGVGTPNLQKLRVHHNVSFQYPYPPLNIDMLILCNINS